MMIFSLASHSDFIVNIPRTCCSNYGWLGTKCGKKEYFRATLGATVADGAQRVTNPCAH